MDTKVTSFTAAGIYPAKVLQNKNIIREGKIVPYHVQLNPTNNCNLHCKFCSCANRQRTEELSCTQILGIMRTYRHLGCESVTITGGGEPLLHKEINKVIRVINNLDISIGLVSNGMFFNLLAHDIFRCITWSRVSFDDTRVFGTVFENTLEEAVKKGKEIDWSFSYVLSSKPNMDNLIRCVEFANEHKFTHVRIVSNLLDLDNVPDMEFIKKFLLGQGVNDDLVIYQGRKGFTAGRKKCLISLLKPVVSAKGEIFPCCGVQYALEKPSLDYESAMCMGTISDIESIYENQKHFDGSICTRCYYSDYNDVLDILTLKIEHLEFV